jgi:hypothetical protein
LLQPVCKTHPAIVWGIENLRSVESRDQNQNGEGSWPDQDDPRNLARAVRPRRPGPRFSPTFTIAAEKFWNSLAPRIRSSDGMLNYFENAREYCTGSSISTPRTREACKGQ